MEINKIKVQNVDFDIRDISATKTVELLQAEYDALATKDPNTLYIITDATGGDLSDYYTKSETSGATEISTALASKADTATTYTKTEVDTALGGKQATLVSGTNIKTINNTSLLGSGNIDIQGGGDVTVDPSLDSGSTNPVANSAITNALHETYFYNIAKESDNNPETKFSLLWKYIDTKQTTSFNPSLVIAGINGTKIASLSSNPSRTNFELVETSAITTSMSSASTDSQVPSAKAVYDQFGGLKLVKLTQAEYDALATKDTNTLYVIVN